MAEEELSIKGKREPPKLTTPYITKTDSYTPGRLVFMLLDPILTFNVV